MSQLVGTALLTESPFLRCDEARLVEGTKLERLVRAGKLTSTHAASAELVGRAQAALGGSRDTKIEVTVLLRAESFIA
jgi:hypothetical protein